MTVLTARHPILENLSTHLQTSGKWDDWRDSDPRLAGHASLQDALEAWRRERSARAYLTVAALASIGSSRGGKDDDAALAVAFLLQDGIVRIAVDLRDQCELDDVLAAVWEEVKRSAPNLGHRAPRFLLQRAKARALAAGHAYMANRDVLPLRALDSFGDSDLSTGEERVRGRNGHATSCVVADAAEEAATDLVDLLAWARGRGVVDQSDVDLVVELVTAAHATGGRETAFRILGERHGVALRTIRRRQDAVVGRLRAAAGDYFADVS